MNHDPARFIQSINRQTQISKARSINIQLAAVPSGAWGSRTKDSEQAKTKPSGAANQVAAKEKGAAETKADSQNAAGNTCGDIRPHFQVNASHPHPIPPFSIAPKGEPGEPQAPPPMILAHSPRLGSHDQPEWLRGPQFGGGQ